MAVMSDTDRWRTWATAMRIADRYGIVIPDGVDKPTLRADVNAIDTLLENSKTNVNGVLSTESQAGTIEYKAFLVAITAMRRAGMLRAEED